MLNIIKANLTFYALYAFFFLVAAVVFFNIEKGDEVLYFARERQPDVDAFFYVATTLGEAYAYLFAIVLLSFIRFRYALLMPLVGLATLVTSLGLKAFFATPRPKTFFYQLIPTGEINFIPDLYINIGYNSFPSGHSMSGFAIFTFVALCITNKRLATLFLIPAALVAFSRIVLTQHFLDDIMAGSLIGLLLATLIYYLQSLHPFQPGKWYDRSLSVKIKKHSSDPLNQMDKKS